MDNITDNPIELVGVRFKNIMDNSNISVTYIFVLGVFVLCAILSFVIVWVWSSYNTLVSKNMMIVGSAIYYWCYALMTIVISWIFLSYYLSNWQNGLATLHWHMFKLIFFLMLCLCIFISITYLVTKGHNNPTLYALALYISLAFGVIAWMLSL